MPTSVDRVKKIFEGTETLRGEVAQLELAFCLPGADGRRCEPLETVQLLTLATQDWAKARIWVSGMFWYCIWSSNDTKRIRIDFHEHF